ncbi:MAG: DJ-1/PfpI family protein [Candidatus Competibacter sp.]|nr:DJ-1/PfpI family protein [Candidatus Competibacter sp.]
MSYTIGIYLFDEVEVLDFAGPFEVFSTAARVAPPETAQAGKLFEVCTVAQKAGSVRARGGLRVLPDFGFSSHPAIDALVVPGGIVTAELENREVIEWLARTADRCALILSVCTGAFLLGAAGLLDGKSATTHWEDIADLRAMFPSIAVRENARWIDEGRVMTSAGISAGIDLSLHAVERLAGRDLALRTARQMEFDWIGGK